MPGRFSNLEFEHEPEQRKSAPRARSVSRGDEQNHLGQADEAYRWGHFEVALRLYTRCLEANRAVVPAWVGQVQMLVQLGECHEARLWSDKALALFRDNGDLLAGKAQACIRLKDRDMANQCTDASLQSPNSSPWRWIVRGEVLLAKGQRFFDECFQKALAEKGADWFDRVVIGRIYLFYRRATNALYYLKQACEMEPTHGYVWYEMGNAQLAMGLTTAARASFERSLDLRRDFQEAQQALKTVDSMGFSDWLKRILKRRIW